MPAASRRGARGKAGRRLWSAAARAEVVALDAQIASLETVRDELRSFLDEASPTAPASRRQLLRSEQGDRLLRRAVSAVIRVQPPAYAREMVAQAHERLGDAARAAETRAAGDEPFRQAWRVAQINPGRPLADPLQADRMSAERADALGAPALPASMRPPAPRAARAQSLRDTLAG